MKTAAELKEISPGVYVDPARARLPADAGRKWVLLDAQAYAELGLPENYYQTLVRLALAGFIRLYGPSPRGKLLDVVSWVQHLQATAEDPWFWQKPENIARYRATYKTDVGAE